MEEERESGWIGSEKEPLLPVLEPARRSGQPTFDGDDALLPHHVFLIVMFILVVGWMTSLGGLDYIPNPWFTSTAIPIIHDAPFSQLPATMKEAITCPNGVQGAEGGVVLLVHGTGSNGRESWGKGPYIEILPSSGKGYDVCWIDLPGRSLGDAQLSAEFVAFAIKHLASQSRTKRVAVIGHSQGAGLNPQWALTFWPSIRPLVSSYIALAADFHGTDESYFMCSPLKVGACEPSVWQQTIGSHYLSAQNSLAAPGGGGEALVPTTSIYTVTDDVIQPETPPFGPTSYLEGAVVLALQDLSVCGPSHQASHFSMVFDPAAFGLAKNALENPSGMADVGEFDRLYCTYLKDNVALNPSNLATALATAVADAMAFGVEPRVTHEPSLQPYVCDRGFANKCGKAF